jgi:hypothetical protein
MRLSTALTFFLTTTANRLVFKPCSTNKMGYRNKKDGFLPNNVSKCLSQKLYPSHPHLHPFVPQT